MAYESKIRLCVFSLNDRVDSAALKIYDILLLVATYIIDLFYRLGHWKRKGPLFISREKEEEAVEDHSKRSWMHSSASRYRTRVNITHFVVRRFSIINFFCCCCWVRCCPARFMLRCVVLIVVDFVYLPFPLCSISQNHICFFFLSFSLSLSRLVAHFTLFYVFLSVLFFHVVPILL